MPDRPRMLFNAFTMFTPSHHTQGMWAEPDSKQLAYNDPETWIELAASRLHLHPEHCLSGRRSRATSPG